MRTYTLTEDEHFVEYKQEPFERQHFESHLEDWLEKNPHVLLEDEKVLYIGRQVGTSLGKAIDLMGILEDGSVLVVELKRDRTPREVIAQALEYAASVKALRYHDLEAIAEGYLDSEGTLTLEDAYHEAFGRHAEDVSAWNTEQRIAIVAQEISPEIIAVASFLRTKDVDIRAVQFGYFESEVGSRLVTTQTIVGSDSDPRPSEVGRAPRPRKPKLNEQSFIQMCQAGGFSRSEELYMRAKALHQERQDTDDFINWGVSGYSYRIPWQGNPNGDVVFIGYYDNRISLWKGVVERAGQAGVEYVDTVRTVPAIGDKIDNQREPFIDLSAMSSDDMEKLFGAIRTLSDGLTPVNDGL